MVTGDLTSERVIGATGQRTLSKLSHSKKLNDENLPTSTNSKLQERQRHGQLPPLEIRPGLDEFKDDSRPGELRSVLERESSEQEATPLSTPASLTSSKDSAWDASLTDSDDEFFSDSTGTPTRLASSISGGTKGEGESPLLGHYLQPYGSSSSFPRSSAESDGGLGSPLEGLVKSSSFSSLSRECGLDRSYSVTSFQSKGKYGKVDYVSPRSKSYSSCSSSSGSIRRRYRKGANTRVVTPKIDYTYLKPEMKGKVKEPKLDDEEFFKRIEAEWRDQDKELTQKGSWLSSLLWLPVLLTLRVANIIYFCWFIPISITARTLFGVKMKWAPIWDVPLEAKKQATVVFGFVMLLPAVIIACQATLLFLVFPLTTLPTLLYIFFILQWDKSPIDGSRRPVARYWKIWRHFVNYFPCRLIKTHNLDPEQKYIFCYHPHGIISMGVFGNFATDASGFSRKFPGIDLRVLTLKMNFLVPMVREFLLHMGICSCAKKGCDRMLNRGKGSAILLVVGGKSGRQLMCETMGSSFILLGAEESLYTSPGTYRLALGGRKGFVRAALDNGANLVPVLGFGENDAYNTCVPKKGSWSRWIQYKFKQKFGFATPIFYGKGPLIFMPLRTPIISVVGKPIPVPQVPPHLRGSKLRTTEEGRALVDVYHKMYIDALKELYDTYKNRWALNRHESLLLVHRERY